MRGAAAGAVIGGAASVFNAKKAQELKEQRKAAVAYSVDKNLLNNAGNAFKHGGVLLAKQLDAVQGGSLTPISDDAVEVNANNPNQTDSVELKDAYVDDSEIIDRKNRVFSDSVFLPNGKSVAKEAKRLEKQKAEDYETRFKSANQRIDQKLDELFAYQESSKNEEQAMGKPKKARGGIITGITSPFHNSVLHEPAMFDNYRQPSTVANPAVVSNGKRSTRGRLASLEVGGLLKKLEATELNSMLLGGRLDPQTGIEQALTQREIARLRATGYEKMNWEKGGRIGSKAPALMYTPYKKRFAFGGEEIGDEKKDNTTLVSAPNEQSIETKLFESDLSKANIVTRESIDQLLLKNYPGKNLQELDEYNVPVTPGTPDSHEISVVRRHQLPTTEGGPKRDIKFTPAKKLKKGGKIGYADGSVIGNKPIELLPVGDPTKTLTQRLASMGSQGATAKSSSSFNVNPDDVATSLSTFVPNMVNQALTSRLQAPNAPAMETATRLKRFSPNAQLAENASDFRGALETTRRNTAQGANYTSAVGSLLSRKLGANNQVFGQVNNLNNQVNNEEAYMNQGVNARNAGRRTEYNNELVGLSNAKTRLTSDNVANLSTKLLTQGRERNLMKLDKSRYDIISKQYGDLPAEMRAKYPTVFDAVNAGVIKAPNRFGGKIKSVLLRYCK